MEMDATGCGHPALRVLELSLDFRSEKTTGNPWSESGPTERGRSPSSSRTIREYSAWRLERIPLRRVLFEAASAAGSRNRPVQTRTMLSPAP
jgi:hypothetical protein